MRIKLDDAARGRLAHVTRQFFGDDLDLELSDFQAQRLIDFFVHQLGAPVYNQAVQDVRRSLHEKLEDLEGEFYEPEADR